MAYICNSYLGFQILILNTCFSLYKPEHMGLGEFIPGTQYSHSWLSDHLAVEFFQNVVLGFLDVIDHFIRLRSCLANSKKTNLKCLVVRPSEFVYTYRFLFSGSELLNYLSTVFWAGCNSQVTRYSSLVRVWTDDHFYPLCALFIQHLWISMHFQMSILFICIYLIIIFFIYFLFSCSYNTVQ